MLELDGVGKTFYDPGRGAVHAVDGISVRLGEGTVAVVGANGAGKSTLLRLITTLLVPDRGRIRVAGSDTVRHGLAIRRRLGYLAPTTRLPGRLTGREALDVCAALFALPGAVRRARQDELVGRLDLAGLLDSRIAGLSTGQLQRLNLARTLLPDPDLVVLDEPTSGLDVVAARELIDLIRAARRPGRLILLSTHIVREVERCADRLLVLRQGRLIRDLDAASLAGIDLEPLLVDLLHPAAGVGASAGAGPSP